MEQKDNRTRILVAGAGGHLGKQVVELLHGQGYENLIAASRNPSNLGHFADSGIKIRRADFNDPASLYTAFKDIDHLLLISTDELQTPGLRIEQHLNAVNAAKAAGIKHIVYTSMPNPETSLLIPFAQDHVATEQALMKSGIGYTILRVSWYCENLQAYLPQVIATGKWPTAAGDGKMAFISREDVARAAAAALIRATDSRIYNITGTASLSIPEIARVAADVFGKTIAVTNVSDDQIDQELTAIGIQKEFIPTVVMTDLNTRAGQFDIITSAVEQLTGVPPQSLNDFLRANKTRFVSTF